MQSCRSNALQYLMPNIRKYPTLLIKSALLKNVCLVTLDAVKNNEPQNNVNFYGPRYRFKCRLSLSLCDYKTIEKL